MLQEQSKRKQNEIPQHRKDVQASVTQMVHWPWGVNVLVAVYEFGNMLQSL